MRVRPLPVLLSVCVAGLVLEFGPLSAQTHDADSPAPAGIGATAEVLTVKGVSYLHCKVSGISRRYVTVQHVGGIVAIPWEDLPESWRKSLASQIPIEKPRPTPTPLKRANPGPTPTPARVTDASAKPTKPALPFLLPGDEPPEIRPSVDFREKLYSLGLWVKNQGYRPSCSVYAIISALEIQYSLKLGRPIRFSEEHLLRATEECSQASPLPEKEDTAPVQDAGYTLLQVIQAANSRGLEVIKEPPKGIIEEEGADSASLAVVQPKVKFLYFPKENPRAQVGRFISVLNENIPIPLGLDWPPWRMAQGGLLDNQATKNGLRHAVTLVGYQNTTGQLEDTVFIFKNSYGQSWGAAGFGRVTYRYLVAHLQGAVVLVIE